MARHAASVMSEADTLGLLNHIDDRLSSRDLDQRQFDVLVRLRAMLQDDVAHSAWLDALRQTEAGASRTAA